MVTITKKMRVDISKMISAEKNTGEGRKNMSNVSAWEKVYQRWARHIS